MLEVIVVGFGMLRQMSVRESQRPRLLRFDLPTPRVNSLSQLRLCRANKAIDANLFKEAFIKAQQENEALFAKA